jgi:hypothetical protein
MKGLTVVQGALRQVPHFSHRAALVPCDGDAEVSLPRPGASCLSCSPPIVRPRPALQAGSRALLGMVHSDLLLLLLLECSMADIYLLLFQGSLNKGNTTSIHPETLNMLQHSLSGRTRPATYHLSTRQGSECDFVCLIRIDFGRATMGFRPTT